MPRDLAHDLHVVTGVTKSGRLLRTAEPWPAYLPFNNSGDSHTR
jgi:Zn/Cd-binding protein ZinT